MGAGLVHVADLDEFVVEVDRRGGISSPDSTAYVADFSLDFATEVDDAVDGFSPHYESMQLELYRELADREIDQATNEQMPLDVEAVVGCANPYGSGDVDHIAHHARTILTSIIVSDLAADASVLDVGCGWGISTEMFGFCGCRVHAVDINPRFVELVARRCGSRANDVTTEVASFDTFRSDRQFDLVYFYESLHHAIRPWEVIARFGGFVKPGGKFAIAGEPIQSDWWRQWGLRLDPQSVYCIRKFGWFENGWSEDFIGQCFGRADFELTVLPGIGFRHSSIGVATRTEAGMARPSAHWAVPPPPALPPPSLRARVARRLGSRPVP